MKAWAGAIVAVGVLLAIIGFAISMAERDAADSMSWYDKVLHDEEYDEHVSTANAAMNAAAFGVILIVGGVIAGAIVDRKQPTRHVVSGGQISSDSIAFCPYCGNPLHGAIFCTACGRRIQAK